MVVSSLSRRSARTLRKWRPHANALLQPARRHVRVGKRGVSGENSEPPFPRFIFEHIALMSQRAKGV